jgi:hypothetical protein
MAAKKKRKPTIEDRLEAIVHTLELLAGMQLQTEKKLDRLAAFTLTNTVSHHKRLKRLEGR